MNEIEEVRTRQDLLKKQNEWFNQIMISISDGVITTDTMGRVTFMNPSAETLTGWDLKEALGKEFDTVFHIINEFTKEKVGSPVTKVLELSKNFILPDNTLLISKNKKKFYIEDSATPIKERNGELLGVVLVFRNISNRRRLEKILAAEKKALEGSLQKMSLDDAINTLLKDFEEISGEMRCSILFVDDEGKKIRSGPGPGLPQEYKKIIDALKVEPELEPFGTALKKNQQIIVSDIEHDILWRNYKHLALKFGLKSHWAYPIRSFDNKISGIFSCYFQTIKTPSKKDEELIERAVNLSGLLIDKDLAIKEYRKSDELVKEISSSLPAAVYQLKKERDGKYSFSFISEGIKNLVGLSSQEIYQDANKLFSRIHKDDLTIVKSHLENYNKYTQVLTIDYRIMAEDKNSYTYLRDRSLLSVAEKESPKWIGTLIDITDIKKAEETIRIQNIYFQELFNASPIGISMCGKDEKIINANKAFEKMFQYNINEIEGKSSNNIIIPPEYFAELENIKKELSRNKSISLETKRKKKDGQLLDVMLIQYCIFNANNHIGTYSIYVDISQTKQWEKSLMNSNTELKKINDELDRFVYSTSHDLRAPLASIQGLINIAELDMEPLHTKAYLERMKTNIRRLDDFIQDIVNYSRNARLKVLDEKIDLKKAISDIIENLHFMEEAEKIKFIIEIKEETDFISDKNRIMTVFNNLISNAIKYHNLKQEDPFINIKVEVNKIQATIEIKDNGQGIPEKYQQKIFEMFFRASKKSSGSGLGLYIVKEIVNKLNGTIELQSQPGLGSTFIIKIPNSDIPKVV